MSHLLTDNAPILPFDQSLIVGTSRTTLGELDQKLVEKLGHHAVDKPTSVVTVKAADDKRILGKEILENRLKVAFADLLDTTDDLPLGDLIDGVDVIDPFPAVLVSLMNGIDTDVTGFSLWIGTTALPVASGRRLGLVNGSYLI